MKVHNLKIWPHFLDEIVSGRKTFDVRDGRDRIFQAGDQIMFIAWDPKRNEQVMAAPPVIVAIIAVYPNVIGVDPNYVALSIKLVQP